MLSAIQTREASKTHRWLAGGSRAARDRPVGVLLAEVTDTSVFRNPAQAFAAVTRPQGGRGLRQSESTPTRLTQGTFHAWLEPPVQLHICSDVPSAELGPVASRHLPELGLTSWLADACVHCCA